MQIIANVTVAADVPTGSADIGIEPGYSGSAFTGNCQGQSVMGDFL